MARIASHHWHVVVDELGKPTPTVLEHEHTVNRGRRHAHYHDYDSAVVGLQELGRSLVDARLLAMRLDGLASTTLSFDKEPRPTPVHDSELKLHPEVRRSLT